MRKFLPCLLAVPAALASPAAQACYTGPMPVTFGRGTAALTEDGVIAVGGYGHELMRFESQEAKVRIVIYNPRASTPRLLDARIAAMRKALREQKVPDRRIEVVPVQTKGGMVAGEWVGRKTSYTVELTRGCGS